MNGEERRALIIERLTSATVPISARCLAEEFSVTRQIIVADIALLRAAGQQILASSAGYSLSCTDGLIKRIVVKHDKSQVLEEFYAVVDNGAKVIDVIIEHPMYGKISVDLNVSSRYDAEEFVRKSSQTNSSPLSLLTEGVHVHTITVKDEKSYERIIEKLSALNILIETT